MNRADELSLAGNVFEQINSICQQFRRAWKQGTTPNLDEHLTQLPGKPQSTLFQNLLHIEIEARRRLKQNPTAEEYNKRFPQFVRLIRQSFFMSTMMSMQGAINTPMTRSGVNHDHDDNPTMSFVVPAANQLGDYYLLRELGRGGFGVVYEARHQQRRNHVALKTLPLGQEQHGLGDADRLHKFRREFRSLADINHPNLVGMQTLEVDGGQWFFTMDLIDGEDFTSYVRPEGELDEARLRAVLPQLANGIMALHGQHIVHRDLKPSNVLVDAEGKVTILDFGLVIEIAQRTDQTQSLQSARFAGTPVYAAPEQIVGQTTAASDWYALGIMLYEALCGERPYHGAIQEIFEQKRHGETPSLRNRDDLPHDLIELAFRLMQTAPEQRADALGVAQALSLDTKSRSSTLSTDAAEDLEISETGQVLVGREQQLATLNQLRQRLVTERGPLAVFITGRSGEGKTSLAEAFLMPLRQGTEVLVLSGRCYDRETVPFKAIDSIIDSLVSFLRGRSKEQLAQWLPKDTRMLAHLFPVLGRVGPIAEMLKTPIGQLDSKQIRYRAFHALRELLANISQSTPIVMFIDDLQWGDADSASVLYSFLSQNSRPALLLVGSYRRDEAEESPFLREWDKLKADQRLELFQPNIAVGPLSESQCVALVVNRIGIDHESIRARAVEIHRSTGGNPYFLDQLIDCYDPDTGSFRAAPLHEVIERKLSKLSADALPLLKFVAISGRALSVAEASQAAGQGSAAYATLTHMRNERLVRLIGTQDRELVDTYHDKIRETVLERLPVEERSGLHRVLGETLERNQGLDGRDLLNRLCVGDTTITSPPGVFDLAYHFQQAGDGEKSLAYAVLAAEHAVSQYALAIAIEHYQLAETKLKSYANALRYRVKYGLGSAMLLAGQYESATQRFNETLAAAGNEIETIRAKSQLADIIYKTGSLRESIAACEVLLRDLGLTLPFKENEEFSFGFRSQIKGIVNRYLVRKNSKASPPEFPQELVIRLLLQLAYPCMFSDRTRFLWATTEAEQRARSIENDGIKSTVAAFHMFNFAWFNNELSPAQHLANQAFALAEEANNNNGQALVHVHWGGQLCCQGRFRSAVEQQEIGAKKFNAIGDIWRQTISEANLAISLAQLGDFVESRNIAARVFRTAIAHGQFRLAQLGLVAWIDSTNKRFPLGELTAAFDLSTDDLFATSWFESLKARWALKNDQVTEAIEAAKSATAKLSRFYPFLGGPNVAFPILAHALRFRAIEMDASVLHASRAGWKNSELAAWQAVRFTRSSTFGFPYALRELALNRIHFGKLGNARKCILESCAVAQRQEAKYEYAESLLVMGQIGEKLGRPEARQQIEQATAALAEFDRQRELATFGALDNSK